MEHNYTLYICNKALIHASSLSEKAPGFTDVLGLPSVSVECGSGTGIQQI